MRNLIIGSLVILSLVFAPRPGWAQITNAGKGSTVQGDILRGEGVYLQGLGWYELNDAKAAAQNADTMMRLENWNREVQLAYRREYNAAIEQRNYRTKKAFEEAQRKHEEKEVRLRTKPTPEDIAKGDALNALLADLSDSSIHESSWRGAKVPLPSDISIKSLAFQFAPKPGAKESAALTRGLIALGRLDTAGHWPDVFPLDKLKAEISAYENSYRKIREESLAGRIRIETLGELDRSLAALETSVGKVVPTDRGFRAAALAFVRELKLATRMFDATTLSYAREMIADTSQHEAHTVSELLGFMRKYRLMFAKADVAPRGDEIYKMLYVLLKEQHKILGLIDSENIIDGNQVKSVTARVVRGQWSLQDNILVQSSLENQNLIVLGSDLWSDYNLEFEFYSMPGQEGFCALIHYLDEKNYLKCYAAGFNNTTHGIIPSVEGEEVDHLAKKRSGTVDFGRWIKVRIEVRGGEIRFKINDQELLSYSSGRFNKGRVAIGNSFTSVRFRNLRVLNPQGTVLFQGPYKLVQDN